MAYIPGFTREEVNPIFYYEQLSPQQIGQVKSGIQGAEQNFLNTWGNQSSVNGYSIPSGLDPVTRALTAFNASQMPSGRDQWDTVGNSLSSAPNIASDNSFITPSMGWGVEPTRYGTLAQNSDLKYTSPVGGAQNPGDMFVQQPEFNLFQGYGQTGGGQFGPSSTVDWINQQPSAYEKAFYPQHVTGIERKDVFDPSVALSLASIVGSGMGGMLAAPGAAGVSAGANAGALSASEAAGVGGLGAGVGSAAPAATTGITSTTPSLLSMPSFESGTGASYYASGGQLIPTSGTPSGLSQIATLPDVFNVSSNPELSSGAGSAPPMGSGASGPAGASTDLAYIGEGIPMDMGTNYLDQPSWWDTAKGLYGSYIKPASPLFQIGSQAIKSYGQKGMMEDLARAQDESYNRWRQGQDTAYQNYLNTLTPLFQGYQDSTKQAYQDWLSTLNPPEDVKQTRLAQAEAQIRSNATEAQRRLSNTLAARGIRGQGTAAPQAAQARSTQDALNSAYQNIYGQYNVPSQPYTPPVSPILSGQVKPPELTNTTPPPVNYAPSWSQLMGQNVGDIGTILSLLSSIGGKK